MPLPLTVSCFSKIQIGYTFLVLAHPGSPGKRAVKGVFMYLSGSPEKIILPFCLKVVVWRITLPSARACGQ